MRSHSRDRRREFAVHFGKSYFKSAPLINPSGLIGFAIPCALLLLALIFVAHPHLAMGGVAFFPLGGITVKELRSDRASLHEKMKALIKKADDEKRSMSAEETQQWNLMDADLNAMKADIDRREKTEAEERDLARPSGTLPAARAIPTEPGSDGQPTSEEITRRESRAFTNWVRYGFEGINQEDRTIMSTRRAQIDQRSLPAEMRAQSTTTTAGGYLVPQGFSGELERELKAFGGMRQAARVFPTPDGRDIPWPTVDDTSNVGEIIGENSQQNGNADVSFGQVILKAYKYSSKIVLVSVELLQDSFFNIDQLLASLLAERIGRITNQHFTTGRGSTLPKGITQESGIGAFSGAGTVAYEDLVELQHSVDPSYRLGARWMFADSTLKELKKLTDGMDRPLWAAGLATKEPDTILGYPYTINQDVPALDDQDPRSILFGDFSKYIIRDARDVTLVRLVERYAEYGQVGFLAFSRHDGRSIAPSAVKYYYNSASTT